MATLALTSADLEKLQHKYPSRIPVFMIRARGADPSFPTLTRQKFLVPKDLTLGMFSYVVRKHLSLPPEKALFLFVENYLPTTSMPMSQLYAQHKSEDGALRIVYTSESAFGA
jgi:GABA(A) receptor-associated protein